MYLDPRDKNNARLDTPMDNQSYFKIMDMIVVKNYTTLFNLMKIFEKLKDLPVLITIYQATDLTESTVDGHYILKNYCDDSYGKK